MIRRRAPAAVIIAVAAAVAWPTNAPVAAAAESAATAVVCSPTPGPITDSQVERAWRIAATRLAARVTADTLPFGATGRSRYVRTGATSWTSGFFPASLWLLYENTGDPVWLSRARDYTERVLPAATLRSNHDLGFMVGLPADLGAELDPDPTRRATYLRARNTAARSLSTRWNANVGALKSASYSGRWGLIIDSAMNAPLLIQVGRTGSTAEDRRLTTRGLRHMVTLADAFVRADGSTAHRQAFDPRSGRLLGALPGQGLRGSSTWSRGQAWAINGFARAYGLTGDARMLETARRTADYWLSRVPAGCVPAWDLDVANRREPLDSSAAAIAADGLLLLSEQEPDPTRAAEYRSHALVTLGTLTAPPFMPDRGRGVLLRQSYSIPLDRREGTYAWGDTYLLSALSRALPTDRSQTSMTSSTS